MCVSKDVWTYFFTSQIKRTRMTSQSVNVAETYKQITEAEKQALALERMLDDLDTKMDSILDEIKQNDKERREQLDRNSFSQDAQPSSDKNDL